MKTTILRIISALLVLSVLWVNVPGVRADDDYVTEINNYVDQIYKDQKDRDDYLNSIYQDAMKWQNDSQGNTWPAAPLAAPVAGAVATPQVKLQPVPQDPVAFAQMVRQNQERVQQQILQAQQQLTPRQQQMLQQNQPAQVAGRMASPQAVSMPQDHAAFQQMVLQNQAKVRQQIMQTSQQIMQRSQEIMQRGQQ